MSLRNALTNGAKIEIDNGILTISDFNQVNYSVLYACFCEDIPIYHPLYGIGKIFSFENNKWYVDFPTSSALQEFKTKTLLNYLPL